MMSKIGDSNTTNNVDPTKNKEIEVRLDEDLLNAYITLIPLKNDRQFTRDEIINALIQSKVLYGIKDDVINNMVNDKIYFTERYFASE